MLTFVTAGAQGIRVRVVIIALLAAQLLGVDLQVLSGTTDLALPTVVPQYLFSDLVVGGRCQAPRFAHCWIRVFNKQVLNKRRMSNA